MRFTRHIGIDYSGERCCKNQRKHRFDADERHREMKRPEFVFNYRVRNWADYNRALIRRGSLTVWVDEQAVSGWRDDIGVRSRARPRLYADAAIECALVIKAVFHPSLRATQGFLQSVVTLMRLELPVPDYTTMRRRHLLDDVRVLVDDRNSRTRPVPPAPAAKGRRSRSPQLP